MFKKRLSQGLSDSSRKRRKLLRNYLIMVIVIVAVLPLEGVLAQEDEYEIQDFQTAAQTLNIEPVEEWLPHVGDKAVAFTLFLPERLEPLSDEQLASMLGLGIEALEDENEQWADMAEMAQPFLLMVAMDTSFSGTNLNFAAVSTPRGITLESYLDNTENLLTTTSDTEVVILDRAIYQLSENRRVGRLIYEIKMMGFPMTLVQYAYIQDDLAWLATGTIMDSELDSWMAIFEEIMRRAQFGEPDDSTVKPPKKRKK